MDLLGPSLEDLFDRCGRKFTTKTVVMVGTQMLSRMEELHQKGLVHRDIKPENFLIRAGIKCPNDVVVVDLATAKSYQDLPTNWYREHNSLTGTARYMSVNTHLRQEQSRRDDLEAVWHVLLYFVRGSLPWQGVRAATTTEKYEKIGKIKQETTIEDLCGSRPEFCEGLRYIRSLKSQQEPDYDYLRGLLSQALKGSSGGPEDGRYDWDELPEKRPAFPSAIPRASFQTTKATGPTEQGLISSGSFSMAYSEDHYGNRRETLKILLGTAETWLKRPFFTAKARVTNGDSILYNAEAQTTLEGVWKFASGSVYRLGKPQWSDRLMAKVRAQLRGDVADTTSGPAVDRVQEALKPISSLSDEVAWNFLVSGSSGKTVELEKSSREVKELVESELESLPSPRSLEEDQPTTPEEQPQALKRGFALLSPEAPKASKRSSHDDLRHKASHG